MFWQALDEQERRLFLAGAVWLVLVAVTMLREPARRERERRDMVDAVVRELHSGRA